MSFLDRVKEIINYIEFTLISGNYNEFPYCIYLEFNKELKLKRKYENLNDLCFSSIEKLKKNNEYEDIVNLMSFSTIEKFINLDILKNDKIVLIKICNNNCFSCMIGLTHEFKRISSELEIINIEDIEKCIKEIISYTSKNEYFKFPIYIYCEFNENYKKYDYDIVKAICFLNIIRVFPQLSYKEFYIVEPYMGCNQFKIDLTDKYKELLKKRYEVINHELSC